MIDRLIDGIRTKKKSDGSRTGSDAGHDSEYLKEEYFGNTE